MDIGNQMHQQFIKDFIHSLANDDDSFPGQSQSESSLNPNAAEFVPSYLKSSECDDNIQYQDDEIKKDDTTSSTTLVDEEMVGDAQHMTAADSLIRNQRQLHVLMNQLGNQNLPLSEISFSLAPDCHGINVQFKVQECVNRQKLDVNLCQAAGLRLEIGDRALQSTRPGNKLAAQFLSRMSEVLNEVKDLAGEQSLCPKCTGLPKKRSFTELEIERQIEDIKAFESLINEDAGIRYQEAFKELCKKLGLSSNGEQFTDAGNKSAQNNVYAEDNEIFYNDDEDQPYIWDSFTPELSSLKVYKYADSGVPKVHVDELREQPQKNLKHLISEYSLDVPPTTPVFSSTNANVAPAYPKLHKEDLVKNSSNKATSSKDTGSKLQRWRYNLPAQGILASTSTGKGTGTATKKQADIVFSASKRSKVQQREAHSKSGVVKTTPDITVSQIGKLAMANFKIETRVEAGMSKSHAQHVQISKVTKPTATSRLGGTGQTASAKGVSQGSHRIIAPRSTHASQMRQSEVKRRLNLMRGDNDSDVQFNEYIFK